MLQVILKRIAIAIPVILIVASLTFFLVRMAPGGPFDAEKVVPPQVMKNLNAVYNLDAPLIIQYRDYMLNLVQGDFGPSFRYPGRSVTEMIFTGLPVTFELAFYAIIVAMIIGSLAGVIAAVKRNTLLDYVPMTIAMIGICMPTFLLGPLLVLYFGIYLEALPVSGWDSLPGDKILPSITLGAAYAAYIARLSRGGMLETLSEDYIRTARAKGASEASVLWNHVFRNSLLPLITITAGIIPGLLVGSVVVESIFSIDGMGRLVVDSVMVRDREVVLSITLIISILTLISF